MKTCSLFGMQDRANGPFDKNEVDMATPFLRIQSLDTHIMPLTANRNEQLPQAGVTAKDSKYQLFVSKIS